MQHQYIYTLAVLHGTELFSRVSHVCAFVSLQMCFCAILHTQQSPLDITFAFPCAVYSIFDCAFCPQDPYKHEGKVVVTIHKISLKDKFHLCTSSTNVTEDILLLLSFSVSKAPSNYLPQHSFHVRHRHRQ